MSAIARYFLHLGIKVFGYDKTASPLTQELENEGIQIVFDESISALPNEILQHSDTTIFIYTPAIPTVHPQKKYFEAQQIPLYKRSEVLGKISENTFAICVAGTHGKTTTSSLIAHILHSCNVNFTCFLGGISSNLGSNYFHFTGGKNLFKNKAIVVLEADEFDRSFHKLTPNIAVITSSDPDHLDIYENAQNFQEAFDIFAKKVTPEGIVFCETEVHVQSIALQKSYGTEKGENRACNLRFNGQEQLFDFVGMGQSIEQIKAGVPGQHNIENAVAAISVALFLGLEPEVIAHSISTFRGSKRRFEYIINTANFTVIDDYAHHPGELTAFIGAVRSMYSNSKITGIFQPHLFTRTRDFATGFAHSLALLDELWLMDIYPAREAPIEGITSQWLLDTIPMEKKELLATNQILNKIKSEHPQLLLIMGAGDIDRLVPQIQTIYSELA